MTERRAVLFDLDDTLYPLERFITSGFRAVAAAVEAQWGVAQATAFGVLAGASRVARGRELQQLAERFDLGADAVPQCLDVFRRHVPDMALPASSVAVLQALAADWALGIVTNGRPDIQARKVHALGVSRFVDVVVFAAEHGSGAGKPEPAAFLDACRRLDVSPTAAVFVGDDLRCDMAGARAVGMKTIWVPASLTPATAPPAPAADAVVASLTEVPDVAARLLPREWRAHVA
jgi:putative hydrolase of the HAD superfamily